ncbi:hypothetical protein M2138_001613 [Dysgonomonadaceae bacterium PH5-43]|nr:hypothetical protein [Dysgonomonadaceae bacterium PH5-43]
MVKNILLSTFCFLCSLSLMANDDVFPGILGLNTNRGMKQTSNNEIIFETRGYDIIISENKKGSIENDKTLSSFRRKNKIKEDVESRYINILDKRLMVIEGEEPTEAPDINIYTTYYLYNNADGKSYNVIAITKEKQRDVSLEELFVEAFLNKELDKYISDSWIAENINFAGRNIELGTACIWKSPNNVYHQRGQVSWSEFPSYEEASDFLNTRMDLNEAYQTVILSNDYIEIILDGVPTMAYRIVYAPINNYYLPLAVYYAVEEIRGHFVSCIMSHYVYNRGDFEMPLLLEEFMTIPTLPEWANNPFDVQTPEYVSEEAKELNKSIIPSWEVQAITMLPVGTLKNAFDAALGVGFSIGIPIKHNQAIDIATKFAFPTDAKRFNCLYENELHNTKIKGGIVSLGLRYRYQLQLKKDIYLTPYLGLGVFSITSDIVEKIDKNDNKIYYSPTTFDAYAGTNLRYKNVGIFAEYRISPFFGNRANLGGSSFSLGVSYNFQLNY